MTYAPPATDEEILDILQCHKAGQSSRTIGDRWGRNPEYVRTIVVRIRDADLGHSKGRDRQSAKRFWGVK